MSAFIPLKRNCPICAGARRDCRQSKTTNLIHCRAADLNIIPSGWKALGQDKWGFEMYAPANDEQSSEGWQQRQQERSLHRQRELEELRRGALSESERDEAIRRIHRHFGLSTKHRQNLRDRGLCDAQIDRLPYFTFHPGQKVPQFTPANLPGVRRGTLTVTESGFTCPIPNIDGLIIGWQNRFDNTENGKYRWPSGEKSAHLPNGELPIGVYRPDGGVTRRAIGHSEGFLKADIIAQQWGLPTLGAASANFAASPEQWKALLDQLSAELLWTRIIYWFADAGAVTNPNVTGQYIKSWEKLSEWGYSVQVVWWGQLDKIAGDADEISQEARESARLISTDEYLAYAREHGGIRESSYTQSFQELDKDRTITRDEWELQHGFGKRLRERVKKALGNFKGFGTPPAPKPEPKEAFDKLFDDPNQRLSTWQDAVAQGYRYVLDRSAPGLGKSHTAGIALPEAFGAENLWYLSSDHRNPTTGVIETNYVDLPVRNNGLKIDDTRKTQNGNPFLVWPKPGEEADTKGNCPKTDLFQKFRAKNLKVEAAETSPICQTCKLAYLCKKGTGQKYGASFRGDRKNALAHPRIRAHADSMPSPGDFDYSASGIIWDEVGTQLKAMESVAVTLADFDQVWGELEGKAPLLHEQLKNLRLALRPLLTGEAKQPYHGWDDAGIRALLPEKPINLVAIIGELDKILQPDLSFLGESADAVKADAGISKAVQQLINRQLRRQTHEEFSEAFQRVALNWLVPFLKVWAGERGAFRCEWQQLTIFTKSDRHTALAQSAKFNIFLDATISRERLALLLGVKPSEIYVVGQQTPNHNNLRVIHITGMGKLGKDRRESLQERVDLLKAELKKRYPGVVIGDWQKFTEPGDGQWFVNLRGSNEFQHAPALAVFGNPCQNIGHLQALYQTPTGEFAPLNRETPHEGLQRFIAAHIEAEIEQALGRLRSHLRPEAELTFIFVGDYDLSFLGMPIEQIAAFELCEAAGTLQQKSRWAIWNAYKELRQQLGDGVEIGLTQLAKQVGITKGRLSQIAKDFNGWDGLNRCLGLLFKSLYNNPKHPIEVDEDTYWLAQSYLPLVLNLPPLEALHEVATLIKAQNLEGFKRILAAASLGTKSKLLAVLLTFLPPEMLGEIEPLTVQSGLVQSVGGAT